MKTTSKNTEPSKSPLRLIQTEQSSMDEKWTRQVVKLGYTTFPSLLLWAQGRLKLEPQLFNVLLQLVGHWWEVDKAPHPAKETIANRMGKSSRQVQRYLTELEGRGFIQRIPRYRGVKTQTANGYSLSGLVEKLKEIEPSFRKATEQNKIRRRKVESPRDEGA